MPIVTFSALPARQLFPGAAGHYAHTAHLTVGEVDLAAGATVPPHAHPHEQLSYLLAGRAECTIGTETRELTPGMCAVIPGAVVHSFRALTACRVLDIFTPVREDFR
ncbi:MAG: cupin domain-containing protein [Opitutus sp.]|nr:cupin domain-containing protein [Opitutus sp.]